MRKSEKVWLSLTLIFFALYNIPGIPAMGDAKGMFIHAFLTLVPIWLIAYFGMYKVYKDKKLRQPEVTNQNEGSTK